MDIKTQLQAKINSKTKPLGALGQLEALALQIGCIQNTTGPRLEKPVMLVFAADHGLVEEGVSPYPKDVTWQMVMNFVAEGAGINVFCRQGGIEIRLVDAGVDHDFPPGLPVIDAKIARGTRNILKAPAMSLAECQAALDKGRALVADLAQEGCNVLGCGEMGIGNTSASALLMHAYLGIDLEQCVGAGTGLDSAGQRHKLGVLRQAAAAHQPRTPLQILACFGGLEIAMMAGAFLEARARGMVILVDGFIASAALLAARSLEPGVVENSVFCHCSGEAGHRLMLGALGVRPLLDLGLRLGEGSGAALAWPLVQAAVAFLNDMASFESAGVSKQV